MQRVHEQSFYRGWDSTAFHNFLNDPHIIGFGAYLNGKNDKKHILAGFILARFLCGEAEILTFAVAPHYRRHGLGRALLEYLLRFLYRQRAKILFLEVEENNKAALKLYYALGFKKTGRRKAYYESLSAAGNSFAASTEQQKNKGSHANAAKRTDALLFELRLKQPEFSESS